MGRSNERIAKSRMYPDERRVEHTFIEIEVNEKAVRFIVNDSIHKRMSTTNKKPLIPHEGRTLFARHSMYSTWPGIVRAVTWDGCMGGFVCCVHEVVCSARFVRGPQQL